MITPFIRQDLNISSGPVKEDGSASWLLYDTLRNKYFSINRNTIFLLRNWVGGEDIDKFIDKIRGLNIGISGEEVKEFIQFLNLNNLVIKRSEDDIQKLLDQKKATSKHWLIKMIHSYLFFKIPFFRPDVWLASSLPFVKFLASRFIRSIIYILGFVGIFVTIQNYETFVNTFSYFYNLNGFIIFGITIVIVKAFHELGHAYVAKNFGCNVSSIGLAMLVFFPFLYTDTTDAWKLTSYRKRLLINFAGMLTELHIALLATFIWSVSPEGVLKSAAFFLATTSWISSLLINISPFMRFDGYYVLSDMLKADNLQPRAFSLGRWQIREWIFGFNFEPPEQLLPSRRWTFIIYAWATWVYRFFIFIGIALLVYYLTFKILGIILFIIEIVWFIALPIFREIIQWWKLKQFMTLNKRSISSIILFLTLLFILFFPWKNTLNLPAIYENQQVLDVFPTNDSFIENINVSHNKIVNQGDLLIELNNPELINSIEKADSRIQLIKEKLNRRIGSAEDISNLIILENELEKEIEVLKSLNDQKDKLSIYAPISGKITDLSNFSTNQWVNRSTKLFSIINSDSSHVIAFVEENDLNKINEELSAVFIAKNNEIPNFEIEIVDLNVSAVETLPYLSLSSTFGGTIATRQIIGEKLLHRPEKAIYQITFQPISNEFIQSQWQTVGSVALQSDKYSLFQNIFDTISAVLIRESSF